MATYDSIFSGTEIDEGIRTGRSSYNVKNYNAQGDGSTNDKAAIEAAFAAALADLPATVYFPPGDYHVAGGIQVQPDQGEGGLSIVGSGANVTKMTMDKGAPLVGGEYHLLLIEASIDPTGGDYANYIHDINIEGIGFYDNNPAVHVGGDESHAVLVKYATDVTIDKCFCDSLGDEGIDLIEVLRGTVTNCKTVNTPSIGNAGSGISAGRGCRSITMSNNILYGSATPGVQSTVTLNQGIKVATSDNARDIEDIVISGNIIHDFIYGTYVNGADTVTNADLRNITILDNTIVNCDYGVMRTGSNGISYSLKVSSNNIYNAGLYGIYCNIASGNNINADFAFNTIDTSGQTGISAAGTNLNFSGNNISNITGSAYAITSQSIDCILFGGTVDTCGGGAGAGDRVIDDASANGASTCDVDGVVIKNAQSVTSVVDNVRSIRNSRVEVSTVLVGNRGIDFVSNITNNVLINTGLRIQANKAKVQGNTIVLATNPTTPVIRGENFDDCSICNNYVEITTGGTQIPISTTGLYCDTSHNNVRNSGTGAAVVNAGTGAVNEDNII